MIEVIKYCTQINNGIKNELVKLIIINHNDKGMVNATKSLGTLNVEYEV